MAWAYTNGREHERAARRRAEEAQRDKASRELDRRLRETELQIARNEARMEMLREHALDNEGLRNAFRLKVAAHRGCVTGRFVNSEPVLELKPDHGVTEEEVDAAIRIALCIEEPNEG